MFKLLDLFGVRNALYTKMVETQIQTSVTVLSTEYTFKGRKETSGEVDFNEFHRLMKELCTIAQRRFLTAEVQLDNDIRPTNYGWNRATYYQNYRIGSPVFTLTLKVSEPC